MLDVTLFPSIMVYVVITPSIHIQVPVRMTFWMTLIGVPSQNILNT